MIVEIFVNLHLRLKLLLMMVLPAQPGSVIFHYLCAMTPNTLYNSNVQSNIYLKLCVGTLLRVNPLGDVAGPLWRHFIAWKKYNAICSVNHQCHSWVHTWIDQIDREMFAAEGGRLPAQCATHVKHSHYVGTRGQAGPHLAASGRRVRHADPPFDATCLSYSNIVCFNAKRSNVHIMRSHSKNQHLA